MADDQGGGLPLQGVRVVELGGIGPVPFAGQQLVNMGADVVRVDRPVSSAQDAQMDPLAHGKRSIALDLTTDDGARTARSLVARAQVVLEGFRPGVAERLGVGPVSCLADNPSLVYGRMTGWGQHGPLASVAGHDINYIGRTGALHALGRFGQPPTVPLFLIGDLGGGGMFLLAGVLAALHRAGRTGRGDVVDAAIVDGVAQLMTPVYAGLAAGEWVDERGMNLLDSGRPWYDVYETADGLWMSVGAIEDKFYAEFVRLLGIEPERAGRADPAGWPALREAIAARFASRPRAYWQQVFDTAEACVAPVLSLREAPADPHLAARGTFAGTIRPAAAPRFATSVPPAAAAAPRPGQHTQEILDDWQLTLEDS